MSKLASGIIGENSSLTEVFKILSKVAPTDSTVLITGESGTGKEVLVRALHNASHQKDHPFIPVNCGAIPKELLESELFGHEKGAFTHAIRMKPGRFELAEGGTIFLDEIGEMDVSLQVKILRVLQEKEIERVGGSGPRKVNVRIVAATNRDLETEVALGNFREDLFYRLNVIPMHLPPLRERGQDILALTNYFLKHFCEKKERPLLVLSEDVARVFLSYPWPGNVRELENLMERLSILADGPLVLVSDLPPKLLAHAGGMDCLENLPILSDIAKESLNSTHILINQTTNQTNSSLTKDEKKSLTSIFGGQTEKVSRQTEITEIKEENNKQANLLTYDDNGYIVLPGLADMKKRELGIKEFLELIEDKIISEALEHVDGVKNQAAELLGIKRTTLIEKLKKRTSEN